MAAQDIFRHRGHQVQIWGKSYRVGNGPVMFVGQDMNEAQIEMIKRHIDTIHDGALAQVRAVLMGAN